METDVHVQPRKYRMRKRLEDIEDTRRRIVEAAVELHGTVGPAETTYSAVAELAGVQRSTVYRHFPDDEALFGACTSHWFARHPWPQTESWRTEPDPAARLDIGLLELYRYYEANEQMLTNARRDMDVMPSFVGELIGAQVDHMLAVLTEAWTQPGDQDLQVAVRHAIDIESWRSLTTAGADTAQAARLMASMVACAASGEGR